MPNLAALCAAVFTLSPKNLSGGGLQQPPGRARVNIITTKPVVNAHNSTPATYVIVGDVHPWLIVEHVDKGRSSGVHIVLRSN